MLKFDDFQLDPVEKRLLRDGEVVPVQPKVFDLLLFFAERSGQLLSHDALMTGVWADTYVGESTLTFYVHSVRKLLGEKSEGRCYIETVPKRGYRFVGNVVTVDTLSPAVSFHPTTEAEKSVTLRRRFPRSTALSLAAIALLVVAMGAWFIRGSSTAQVEKIAVARFRGLTQQNSEFGARLTQALVRELSKIPELEAVSVVPVDDSGNSNADQITAAQQHGAALILSGIVTPNANTYSVDAVLRRAADGAEIWRATVETKAGSDIDVGKFAAIGIAKQLNGHLRPMQLKLQGASHVPTDAITSYLAGQKILAIGDLSRRAEMVRHFQQTVDLAPDWPLVHSGLAEALVSSDQTGYDWDRAEKAAQDALNLDPNEPRATTALAQIYQRRDRNWAKAEEFFKRSFTHDPHNAKTLTKYADLLAVQSRFVEARESLDRALAVEPFSHQVYVARCDVAYFENKYEKAKDECDTALALEADFWEARKRLFWIFVQQKAHTELGDLVTAGLSDADRKEHPFINSLANGNLDEFWHASIKSRLKRTAGTSLDLSIASHYMQINERSKAIDHLEKSFVRNDPYLDLINVDPVFAPLRDEPRFRDLIAKIGLASPK